MLKNIFMLTYVILGGFCLYNANTLAQVVWMFCGLWVVVLHAVIRAMIAKHVEIATIKLDRFIKEIDNYEQTRESK